MTIKSLSKINQKYSKIRIGFQKQVSLHPLLTIALTLLLFIGLAGLIWLQTTSPIEPPKKTASASETTKTTFVEIEPDNTTENSKNLTQKIITFGKKISSQTPSPSPTSAPTSQNNSSSNTSNSNTNSPTNSSPTPSTFLGGSYQPTATPTMGTTITPVQPSPTRVAPTPTATLIPTSTPTSGPIQSSSTVTLLSASGATPDAFGSVSFAITQNSNGYWDFITSGSFQMLQPNRPYQLWICSEGCSSHVNARFTTDGAGSGSITNATINYPQGRYPAQTVRVHELTDVPPGEVIPTDSSRCYQMTGMTPCLQSSVSF